LQAKLERAPHGRRQTGRQLTQCPARARARARAWSSCPRLRTRACLSASRRARSAKAQTSVRPIDGLAARLLGRHVRGRAEHDSRFGHRRRRERGLNAADRTRLERFRYAEVEDLDRAVALSLMFWGFRSRCTMPRSWAASSAITICSAT
jgi:hypothetical protein